MHYPVLIGDIGGTNARFALIEDAHSALRTFKPVKLADFDSLEEAIQKAALDNITNWPRTMVLAVAAPPVSGKFRLTNAEWTIDPDLLRAHFNLQTLRLMNDFTAQGLAALSLGGDHLEPIGGGAADDTRPKVVIGPGTGLGVANLIPTNGHWTIVPGEGGHVDLGPRTEREREIWDHLPKFAGRFSAEEAVSGRGLVSLYRAISAANDTDANESDGSGIAAAAFQGADSAASEAVELFIRLLGRVAGDMALITMARGGVYIAGGITKKLLPMVDREVFRDEFDNKEPYTGVMRTIPVFLMQHQTPALEGLLAYIRQPGRFVIADAAHT